MRNTRKLRIVSLCLMLTLGVTPGLTVYAQQTAQKQVPTQAKPLAGSRQQSKDEKAPSEEDILLSDAEMEKVEGGNPVAIAIGLASLAFAGYTYYQNRKAHHQLMQACTTSRR